MGLIRKFEFKKDSAGRNPNHSRVSQAVTPSVDPARFVRRYVGNEALQRMLRQHELPSAVQTLHRSSYAIRRPAVVQRATIDPDIARRFSSRRVPPIESALARVPTVVSSATHVLDRFLRGDETPRQAAAVAMAFEVFRSQPDWADRIRAIISAYNRARDIIGSPACLITFAPDCNCYGEYDPDAEWEIRVGPDFYFQRPPHWWVGELPFDLGLNQVLTLIHEAIHYIHGPGHELSSPSTNPDRFMQLVLDIRYGSSIAGRFQAWRDENSRLVAEYARLVTEMARLLEEIERREREIAEMEGQRVTSGE